VGGRVGVKWHYRIGGEIKWHYRIGGEIKWHYRSKVKWDISKIECGWVADYTPTCLSWSPVLVIFQNFFAIFSEKILLDASNMKNFLIFP
jgi:hypothetical protein